MTDDIQGYTDDLETALEDLTASLARLDKLKPEQKISEVKKLNMKLKQAKELYKVFEAELRELPKSAAAKYYKKGDDFRLALKEVSDNLERHKAEAERAELGITPEEPTAESIISEAKMYQAKSKQSTENSKKIVQEIITVGEATVNQIKEDTKRLEAISEKLDDIQDELGLARKQLVAIVRKMATDKLIRAFIIILLLGVLFIIIYANVAPKDSSSSDTIPSAS